ncbi:hypothetical protein SAMN05518865_1123 [Duganella sp. CF458]|uniref:hypothetical protein n=1 Tax=Duganella sp. CF458 TaxID=1884368 RepID=UPI0008E02F70|nr:hypothetical protein [Duganella sp. CF458]SFG42702.1 hypothetical protein SAMN05518865_1123 [Duganella sp. CF458]
MIEILKSVELIEFMKELKNDFNLKKGDVSFLNSHYPTIEKVKEWKYATGPIFDQPPYSAELAGFDPGRLLKKRYLTPFEARLKGTYSSGFISGAHVVTISPSKPIEIPIMATFFSTNGTSVDAINIQYPNNDSYNSNKPPRLIGMRRIFDFQDSIRACIIVGERDAYSIDLFYLDGNGLVDSVSMVSAPYDFQSNCKFNYDSDGQLMSVTSNGIVWQRS